MKTNNLNYSSQNLNGKKEIFYNRRESRSKSNYNLNETVNAKICSIAETSINNLEKKMPEIKITK
jgi:hypothetical protein